MGLHRVSQEETHLSGSWGADNAGYPVTVAEGLQGTLCSCENISVLTEKDRGLEDDAYLFEWSYAANILEPSWLAGAASSSLLEKSSLPLADDMPSFLSWGRNLIRLLCFKSAFSSPSQFYGMAASVMPWHALNKEVQALISKPKSYTTRELSDFANCHECTVAKHRWTHLCLSTMSEFIA